MAWDCIANSDNNMGHCTLRRQYYVYITDSSTKYFVARRECKGTRCYVSVASLNGFVLLTPIYWSTIQREYIVVFPWRQ